MILLPQWGGVTGWQAVCLLLRSARLLTPSVKPWGRGLISTLKERIQRQRNWGQYQETQGQCQEPKIRIRERQERKGKLQDQNRQVDLAKYWMDREELLKISPHQYELEIGNVIMDTWILHFIGLVTSFLFLCMRIYQFVAQSHLSKYLTSFVNEAPIFKCHG